jgi:hypothetical protein
VDLAIHRERLKCVFNLQSEICNPQSFKEFFLNRSSAGATQFQPLAEKIEARLRSKTIKQIGQHLQPGEFIYPAYEDLSLINISSTLLKLFGIRIPGHSPLPDALTEGQTEGIRKVILFVVDALGYNQLCPILKAYPDLIINELIQRGRFAPLTSIFPSTTAAALTSLNTGMTPQEHGVLGYQLFLKEYATVANMIGFTSIYETENSRLLHMGLEPERFLGVRTIHQRLTDAGISTYVLVKNEFKQSPLSKMFYNGAQKVYGFVNSSDMFVNLRALLERNPHEQACILVYWDAIDSIAHLYGPDSEAVVAEVRNLSYSLEHELIRHADSEMSGTTLLMLTADHGQVTVPEDKLLPVYQHPGIEQNLLLPPTGDYRAAYLYAKYGKLNRLRDYLKDQFTEQLVAIDSTKALNLGLWGYGDLDEQVSDRMGDLVVMMRRNHAFYAPVTDKPYIKGGKHGGLTPDEMLIPFLCVRLG